MTVLNDYIQRIKEYPLLTPKEEIEYGTAALAGNEEAQLKLVNANLRLVINIAMNFKTNTTQETMDLIQEGNIGLMNAAKRFDPSKGFKFSTYATYWIRERILSSINDNSRSIRIPTNALVILNKIKKVKADLEDNVGRELTLDELSSITEIPKDKIETILLAYKSPLSLDYPVGEDEETEVSDVIEATTPDPNELAIKSSNKDKIIEVIQTLPEREAKIIIYRWGIDSGYPRSLDEVGEMVGLTRERVRQLEDTAMRKLRAPARSKVLKELM